MIVKVLKTLELACVLDNANKRFYDYDLGNSRMSNAVYRYTHPTQE